MPLTFTQRNAVHLLISQMNGKLNEIRQYCDYVNRMEQQDWTETISFGLGGSISKTFTVQEQTGIHDKYAEFKTDLTKFVGQLP